MITVGDPWAAAGDDVPGALPAGVYVRVLDDGHELALVQLDTAVGPRFVSEDDAGWYLDDTPLVVFEALAAAGQSSADFGALIEAARAKGISPFGE